MSEGPPGASLTRGGSETRDQRERESRDPESHVTLECVRCKVREESETELHERQGGA